MLVYMAKSQRQVFSLLGFNFFFLLDSRRKPLKKNMFLNYDISVLVN